jgi:hypothetical protein
VDARWRVGGVEPVEIGARRGIFGIGRIIGSKGAVIGA